MWFQFSSITEREFESKQGKPYTAFELVGIKKGWKTDPDSEWSRKIFKNDAVTVIEKGVKRPNISLVSYFQKAVKPGAMVKIVQERNGQFWDIVSVEDISEGASSPEEYTLPEQAANPSPAEVVEPEPKADEYTPAPWD